MRTGVFVIVLWFGFMWCNEVACCGVACCDSMCVIWCGVASHCHDRFFVPIAGRAPCSDVSLPCLLYQKFLF